MVTDDDSYITAPIHFRCPISLDIMEFPVSLCTGVTYERRNIQRWLDAGNSTCPATMQVLHTQELLPNHTLHRLIKIWSESLLNPPPHSPPPPAQSISRDHASKLILRLETDLNLKSLHGISSALFSRIGHTLSTLVSYADESDGNTKFVAAAGGRVFSLLISVIVDTQSIKNLSLFEKIVIFCNIILKNRDKLYSEGEAAALMSEIEMGKNEFKAGIMTALKRGRLELRIAVAEFLELMATHLRLEMKRSSMAEDDEIYTELLSLIVCSNGNNGALEASLKLLKRLMSCSENRAKMVHAGGVNALTTVLSEAAMSAPLTERVLKLMEMAASCREGRSEICRNESCLQAILKKVLKVSNVATERAVTVLWTLCCLFDDERAVAAVAKDSGMAKILLLLQSNVSPAVRQMCGDLLKAFRCNSMSSSSCLLCYDTKTSHILCHFE